jgi:hypothetical protein
LVVRGDGLVSLPSSLPNVAKIIVGPSIKGFDLNYFVKVRDGSVPIANSRSGKASIQIGLGRSLLDHDLFALILLDGRRHTLDLTGDLGLKK